MNTPTALTPTDRAAQALLATMTPAQRMAFLLPLLQAEYFAQNTAVDLRPGPGAGRMRVLAEKGPKAALMEGEEFLMAKLTHLADEKPGDTAWRVSLIVDAAWNPDYAPGDQWPHWHCTVVYGEKRKDIARTPAPLFKPHTAPDGTVDFTTWESAWPNMRWRKAEALVRKELAGVGYPNTLTLNTREGLAAEGLRRGVSPHLVVGFSGRVKLTVQELHACLPEGYLERITHMRTG